MIRKIFNKINNLTKRAVVSLTNNDEKSVSYCQVKYLADRVCNIENAYPYGMSANAPIGNIVLIMQTLGREDDLIGIPYSQKDRFKNLKPGEVVFGSPKTGSYIKFLENGDIEIECKGNININGSNNVNVSCNAFQGDCTFALGTGGAAIARVGDEVLVDGVTGTITSGSSNNTSN